VHLINFVNLVKVLLRSEDQGIGGLEDTPYAEAMTWNGTSVLYKLQNLIRTVANDSSLKVFSLLKL
jgi:hypothetical protein